MKPLKNSIVVVAGGTGNVGSFLVKELLKNGATVAVPSRSQKNLEVLKVHLKQYLNDDTLSRLHGFVGDIGDEEKSETIYEEIEKNLGAPDAAVASLGKFIPAPTLLDASVKDLHEVVDGYLTGHFVVARTFLKRFKEMGGSYIIINGPLALKPWKDSGSGLISIATAGQQMLFRTLAQELEGTKAKVTELITHAFIRNKETQPGSPLPGEAVGEFVSFLISDEAGNVHGKSIQLRSVDQLEEIRR